MKIHIQREHLLDAVNKVKSVVAPKSALPILSHILMEARGTAVRLSATDLKVSIECEVDCTVDKEGSLTVSSQLLSSMLSALPEGDVSISLGENNVITLESGPTVTKLFSMSPEEFPPIRDFGETEPIVLPQKLLRELFQKTSFAICLDQARYNLTGLLFELSEGRLTTVATDGRRMSLARETEGIPSGIEFKVIVPGKMIVELERLFRDDGEVKILIDETQAGFVFDSLKLVSAIIEGSFPNYDMVIPKKHDKQAVIETARLLDAARRTRTMTNDKFNSVRFMLSQDNLTLKVVTPEVGEYVEDMPVEYQGEDVEIAFNPAFLLDVLRHIDTEKVCLNVKDSMSPGVVKPETELQLDNYVNVIMPIRI